MTQAENECCYHYMFLLLDVKKLIASSHFDIWYLFWKVDFEFREYAESHAGRLDYIREFEVYEETEYSKSWKLFGKLHRLYDLPAVVCTDGTKYWYTCGNRHRENDLPAVTCVDGAKYWYINGVISRENDLPAIIHEDGSQEWWLNGELSREGGFPAIIYANGSKEWWITDIQLLDRNFDPKNKDRAPPVERNVIVFAKNILNELRDLPSPETVAYTNGSIEFDWGDITTRVCYNVKKGRMTIIKTNSPCKYKNVGISGLVKIIRKTIADLV